MSQEFSRTVNRILGALARPDDFLLYPLQQGHIGTIPEASTDALRTSQGTNEDPHPEAGFCHSQIMQNSGSKDRHDMVTGVHQEVTYCSLSTSSGKQKMNRSTSQQQFRSENTPATIEAEQSLLAPQQLANNNNSANFQNNFNRFSKLPKSLIITRPTFDGKYEKFELLEDLF